jgi:ABC-type Fe3+-citrate transport system substrate-binding protein
MTRIVIKEDYRKLRAREYPSVGDQLDALWKTVQALQDGKSIPDDAAEVLSRIRSIKAGAPK